MGCGKTTIGARAAKLAEVSFYDLDDEIVTEAGMPIPDIFAQHGEAGFRELEAAVLRRIAGAEEPSIVATGGGALIGAENAAVCKSGGAVLFLDVPFETCYRRIQGDANRPIASSRTREEMLALYEQRRTVYLRHSNAVVLDGTKAARAAEVAGWLER